MYEVFEISFLREKLFRDNNKKKNNIHLSKANNSTDRPINPLIKSF